MVRRPLPLLLLGLSACVASEGRAPAGAPEEAQAVPVPQWIWPSAEPARGEEAWFRKRFEAPEGVAGATVWLTADDRLELFLNGASLAQSDRWSRPLEADALPHFRPGTNVLAAWARNDGGDAGLCVDLALELADGRTEHVLSDASWEVASTEPADGWTTATGAPDSMGVWRAALAVAARGAEPWGELEEATEYVREEATPASEVGVAEGFVVERVYSVPRARQGSWVSLAVDDQGRLYASDQYGGLYRITPPPPGETLDPAAVEELDVELGEAHGLLWAFGALYAVVSGAGRYESGLYRARDTDGDDRLDAVECLQALDGNGEHGPHAVLLAPDGASLYVFAGNHTNLPARLSGSRVPWLWDEDQLLPRLPDPNGHAVDRFAPGGWVCRTTPDGTDWELVACGFRNSYDGGFDAQGELFAYDSDMEWDVGLPWYRFPRVVHVVPGAEFGWRNGSGKWPADYPDSLPPVVETGLSSPTGCTFGTRTAFPEPWRSTFFVADWAYGKIEAVRLEPRGASYAGTVVPFVEGRGLPVTDLAVGHDGALYFATGGRRLQSGLYRVRWVGGAAAADAPARASEADRALADARRRLEAAAATGEAGDEAALALAWQELDSPDRFVRFAARTVLELRDPALWSARALTEERERARLEALLALVRSGAGRAGDVFPRLLALPWEELDRAALVAALRVVDLAFLRLPAASDHEAEVLARLDGLFPAGDEREDRELCRTLAYLQAPGVVPRALALLEAADSQEAKIDYAYALRVVRTGWTEEERARLLAFLDEAIDTYQGGASLIGHLERIRDEAVAAWGWAAVASSTPAPAAARAEAVADWKLADLVPVLDQVDATRSYGGGLLAYQRAGCTECHRLGGVGRNQGPDLSGAGSRFNARDLLESILEPSRVISDLYQDTEVWTNDDELFVGRYQGTVDGRLRLRAQPPSTELYEIPEEDVALRRPHPLSRMPEGLANVLTEDEVLDLLAFVLGLSTPPGAEGG